MAQLIKGNPCKRGHTTKYARNGVCYECNKERGRKNYAKSKASGKGTVKPTADHWTLCQAKIKVHDVNSLFWNSIHPV